MKNVLNLTCVICGKEYAPKQVAYVCPDHRYEGILDVRYNYDRIAHRLNRDDLAANAEQTIWRYRDLMPVLPNSTVPPLAVGWTPLYQTPTLAAQLGLQDVWVKDDGRNPTGSFKDRASAIAVVKAQEQNAQIITTASTGNAAAALAGICASVGQANVIFVPASAPQAKIAQLLTYGSTVMLVDGTYDDAFELCLQAADEYGWYNRNTGFNPYMTEGKKSVSFEVAEQLAWQAPDVVFVSVGDGCIIGGVHKGFKDLKALGWISHMPRLIGVQAAGSNYLAEAWHKQQDPLTKPAIDAHTVADSISAGLPRDRIKAMAAITETNGAFITVSDAEILAAVPALARASGVFAEPAGAAAYAGLVAAVEQKMVDVNERIVLINTGNGLKDVQGAMSAVETIGTKAHQVSTSFADVERVLQQIRIQVD